MAYQIWCSQGMCIQSWAAFALLYNPKLVPPWAIYKWQKHHIVMRYYQVNDTLKESNTSIAYIKHGRAISWQDIFQCRCCRSCIHFSDSLSPMGKPSGVKFSEIASYEHHRINWLNKESRELNWDTYEERGGDFPGALYSFCILNIGQGSSPVEKSTATVKLYINHMNRKLL